MNKLLTDARSRLESPIRFDDLLATLNVKDRIRIEKQIAGYEASGAHALAELWKGLMCSLGTLAPHRTKVNAPRSIQYYEPDGKNRRQVFAIEDSGEPFAKAPEELGEGARGRPSVRTVSVYCEDILEQAVKGGLLHRKAQDQGLYELADNAGELEIRRLDGSEVNPPEFFKHMIGWNRKALCIKLPMTATKAQIAAAEMLCAISIGED